MCVSSIVVAFFFWKKGREVEVANDPKTRKNERRKLTENFHGLIGFHQTQSRSVINTGASSYDKRFVIIRNFEKSCGLY